jgi:SecD/SecF fusion protein
MLRIQPLKTIFILSVIGLALLFALPNALPEKVRAGFPAFLPSKTISLGLDLQGGSHLLFEVKAGEVFKLRVEGLEDEIRKALNEERIGYTGIRAISDATGHRTTVTIRDADKLDGAFKKVRGVVAPTFGAQSDFDVTREDGNRIVATLTEAAMNRLRSSVVGQSIEVVRRRIDAMGTKEPIILRQGANRIVVQVPGESNPQKIRELISKTARLTFHREDISISLQEAKAGRVPPRSKIYKFRNPEGGRTEILLEERVILSGDQLKSATISTDQMGLPAVSFVLTGSGARKFGDYSSANIGKVFAIVLDDEVISAPVIRGAILGGSGQISGGYKDMQEAADLALLLNAGALPASLEPKEERTVGAELGADSVKSGIKAAFIGAAMVIVFMVIAYGQFGLIANVALIANIVLMLGIITLMRATLTLPGIAGIVLTVGMAVDSNVLIYERIKEELRAGKSIIAAIETGFTRAFGTILDANLTTLIAALILYQLGAGPVRGFAMAHAIGTLTTIFTAYTFTRLLVAVWFKFAKPKRIPIDPRPRADGSKPFHLFPDKFSFPFIKWHRIGFGASALAFIASAALMFAPGLNFSIDFKGGTEIEIHTQGPADLGKIRSIGNSLALGEVRVQEFGAPDKVVIRVGLQEGGDAAQVAAREKLASALTAQLGQNVSVERADIVGPAVGKELVWNSVQAVLIGIALMMAYVWFRFEWQFGLGAVVGLFHDILLTVGVFAVFKLNFDVAIIAALLTTVGYSMNDKVVIYDRIRENLRKYKKLGLKDLIDQSLNETLLRTSITAITTLLALFSLYIFGGHAMHNFVFAMIFGVFVGTYSSVIISAPFLLYVGVKRDWSQLAKDAKAVKSGA